VRVHPRLELWEIGALGDGDDHRLIAAGAREIALEFEAEQTRMGANDIVVAGIIGWRTSKDMDTDLPFRRGIRFVPQRALRHMEQEIPEPRGSLEFRACRNAQD
jgi:hypothetical protein